MNAKESLSCLLESLLEANRKIATQVLFDFVRGKATTAVKRAHLADSELFGCGMKKSQNHYALVLRRAKADKLVNETDGKVGISAKGKKLLKEGIKKYIVTSDDDEATAPPEREPNTKQIAAAQQRLEKAKTRQQKPAPEHIGQHTKLRIQLIQAIDRKIMLDELAVELNVDFTDMLTELEEMQAAGRRFDLRYFLDEVMDPEAQAELFAALKKAKGNLADVVENYSDAYTTEEIRLARLAWKK